MRPVRWLVSVCACGAWGTEVWRGAVERQHLISKRDNGTSPADLDPGFTILRKGKHHCADLHEAKDRCHHARKYCSEDAAGYVDYLSWFYCDMADTPVLGFVVLSTWGAFLFSTIGIASSDFFCPNLATIADLLGMSQSVAGATLLAFGNGSPDVFSTFAAFRANSGSLAIGELLGAAAFITSVVAGTMAVIAPFKVSKKSFLRDAGFFTVAVVMTMILLADGRLRLWEAAAMIIFYILYVGVVLLGTWYTSRTRRKARLRERVRGQFTTDQDNQPDGDDELDGVSDDDHGRDPQLLERDSEPIRPGHQRTRSRLSRASSGRLTDRRALELPADEEEADEHHDEDDAANVIHRHVYQDLNSSMSITGKPMHTTQGVRPSLLGALEFSSIARNIDNERSPTENATRVLRGRPRSHSVIERPLPVARERNSDGRSLSRPRAVGGIPSADGVIKPATLAGVTRSPVLGRGQEPFELPLSASYRQANTIEMLPTPLDTAIVEEDFEDAANGWRHAAAARRNEQNVFANAWSGPNIDTTPRRGRTADRDGETEPAMLSASTSPTSDATGRTGRLPQLVIPENGMEDIEEEPLLKDGEHSPLQGVVTQQESQHASPHHHEDDYIPRWWPRRLLPSPREVRHLLFPSLFKFREQSVLSQVLGIVALPSIFLLTLTLPVVTPELKTPPAPLDAEAAALEAVVAPDDEDDDDYRGERGWNRWLTCVQALFAPFFLASAVVEPGFVLIPMATAAGVAAVALVVLLTATVPDAKPKLHSYISFIGFVVSVTWISMIANEVVGVLQAFGTILGLSDAILGLTIFAIGNSLADFVADVTVARMGFSLMAFSATFGGPLMNILMGLGISGVYVNLARHRSYDTQMSPTLIISCASLLTTLVTMLVLVPAAGYRMTRPIGVLLIAIFFTGMVASILVELYL